MEEGQPTKVDPPRPEERPTPFRPASWALHPAFLIAVCLAGMALIALLYLNSRNSSAKEAVEERLAAIRERGEPVSIEELAPPPVPDDENAALLLQVAFDALVTPGGQERAGVLDWEKLLWCEGEPDMALAKRALDFYADAITKARLSLARPKCRFDLDYSLGHDSPLPHLSGLRSLARLFALEALVRSAEGRGGATAESCLAALAIGRMLETEPILISQLVRIAITVIAIRSMQHGLQRVTFPDGTLRHIRENLLEIDPVSFSRIGLRGERVFLIQVYDDVVSNRKTIGDILDADTSAIDGLQSISAFLFREDEAFALDTLRRILAAVELPPDDAILTVDAIVSEAEAEIHEHMLKHILSGIFLPALGVAHNRAIRTWARRDGAVIGLSCELFRSAKGRYPATLDELSPEFLKELPLDPFTGKPFRYQLRDDGAAFIVYSLGDNLKDDGGVEERPAKDDISWDGRARTKQPASPPAEARGE